MKPWKFAAAALMAMAASVQAETVDYTFNGGNANLGSTASFGPTPYGISVSAHYSLGSVAGGAWQSAQVSRRDNALGVISPASYYSGQIDGNSANGVEGLLFDFGALDFQWLTVTLSLLGSTDLFNLWVGDTLNLSSASAPLETQVYASANASSSTIGFGARYLFIAASEDSMSITDCNTSANCFRVDNITAAVPEPGSLALAGLAMAALAVAGRRRRT